MFKKSIVLVTLLMSTGLSFGANPSLVPITKIGRFRTPDPKVVLLEKKQPFNAIQANFDAMTQEQLQNYFKPGNKTLLHYAVDNENIDAVQYFIGRGMDVNALDSDQKTPLYRAICASQSEIAQLLIQTGRCHDFEQPDQHGNTLLHKAILNYGKAGDTKADLSLIALLIAQGADVNKQSNDRKTPLFDAASQGIVAAVQVLLEIPGIEIDTRCHMSAELKDATPLYAAVYNGFYDVVYLLLEAGANPNLADSNGDTPLHVVIGRSPVMNSEAAVNIITALQQHGADKNSINNKNETVQAWMNKYANNNPQVKAAFERDFDASEPVRKFKMTSVVRQVSRIAWIAAALGSGYKMNVAFEQAKKDIIAKNKAAAENDETVKLITDDLEIKELAGKRLWKKHKKVSSLFFVSVLTGIIDVSACILGF